MATYRWMWRTIWPNLTGYWHDFMRGIGNIRLFARAVWEYRPWDWTGLAGLMEVATRDMVKCHNSGLYVGEEQNAKDLGAIAEALGRLQDDKYADRAGYGPGYDSLPLDDQRAIWRNANDAQEADVVLVAEGMKRLLYWWS